MKITSICPGCAKTLAVAAEHAGKKIRCPNCSGVVQLPQLASVPVATSSGSSTAPVTARRVVPAEKPKAMAPAPRTLVPPRTRKPRGESGDPDLWNESLSSYSSPAIPDEQAESYGLPPKRKKRKSPEEAETSSPYYYERQDVGIHHSREEAGFGVPLILGGINIGSGLMFTLAELAVPGAALIGLVVSIAIGATLALWGGLRIMLNAFEEDVLCGLLYLFIGIYAVYFLFSRWEVNRRPFLIYLIGLGSSMISLCMLFAVSKS